MGNYGDIQGQCDECGTLNIPYPAVTQGTQCRLTKTLLDRNVNLLASSQSPKSGVEELSLVD